MLCAVPEENKSCTWYRDASYGCDQECAFLLLLQLFKSSLTTVLFLTAAMLIAKINYTLSLVPLKTARSSNKHESKIKSYLYIHYILILTTGYVLSGPYDLL